MRAVMLGLLLASWGCGTGDDSDSGDTPNVPVQTGDDTLPTLGLGNFHSCMVAEDGSPSCWGNDAFGAVGQTPSGSFSDIDGGDGHSCGITEDGTARCWGLDDASQVSGAPSGSFDRVALGYRHGCALQQGGPIACWGDDTAGQASAPGGDFLNPRAGSASFQKALRRQWVVLDGPVDRN